MLLCRVRTHALRLRLVYFMADPTDLVLIEKLWNLADKCIEDDEKIDFYDRYPEAFELDPEVLNDARISYSETLESTIEDEEEAKDAIYEFNHDLKNKDRKDLPDEYKLDAFEYAIEVSPVFGHLRDRN